jgi:Zn finger protein HypA/HybF involved in hydrogenase expression
MRFAESVYCEKCGFATKIMTAENAMKGICPHCKKKGLRVLEY